MGNVIKKLVVGLIVGAVLLGITKALEFPTVFQWMFFAYALLGTAVFIILDLASLKPVSGVKAVGALVFFYIVLCVVYSAGDSLWPQYDPEDEKGKIEKILKPKRAATEQGKAEELIARAKALDEQAKALAARIKASAAIRLLQASRPAEREPRLPRPAPEAEIFSRSARINGNFKNATTATSFGVKAERSVVPSSTILATC